MEYPLFPRGNSQACMPNDGETLAYCYLNLSKESLLDLPKITEFFPKCIRKKELCCCFQLPYEVIEQKL